MDGNNGVTTTMPVVPYGGAYGGGDMMGGFGGWWGILLIILLLGGGLWGGMGGMNGMMGGNIYPWMNQAEITTNGFANQANGIAINGLQNAVTSGFGDVQTALCGGFAGVNATINGAQNAIAQQMYANQIAELQGMNGLQSQLASCCCENRLANCQTQNLIQSDGAATRIAIQQQTQAILDKMCQQEIDALKAQNLALQNQVNMQALAASQTAQTAALVADNTAQTQYLVNRISPYPVPAFVVTNPTTPATTTAG